MKEHSVQDFKSVTFVQARQHNQNLSELFRMLSILLVLVVSSLFLAPTYFSNGNSTYSITVVTNCFDNRFLSYLEIYSFIGLLRYSTVIDNFVEKNPSKSC